MTLTIAGRHIGSGHPPFVVAEMSGNHNGSLDRALAIVDAAAAAGADAVKLQTYTADTITLDVANPQFSIRAPASPWHGRRLHDLYREAHTPWDWHETIMARARERGIVCFSTAFDETAVTFLESLGVPAYKIASFEITHLPLIRRVAATGKPLLLSTGMATLAEIDEAVSTARSAGCGTPVLFKCTSAYPAPASEANVATIPHLQAAFGGVAGLSDHTPGIGVAVAAVALGASVIEKHLTLRRSDGGVDSAFSLEPEEFAALVTETRLAWQSLGTVHYGPTAGERDSLQFRQSLFFATDLRSGERITKHSIRCVRPGTGLHPRYLPAILGRAVNRDVLKGDAVCWELLRDN